MNHEKTEPVSQLQAAFDQEDSAKKRSEWTHDFLHHYWPIMLFGTLFLLMCIFPMVLLSGADGPTLPMSALALAIVFGLAITFVFTQPLLLPPLLVVTATILFLTTPELGYNRAGVMLGTWILGAFIFGWMYFTKKIGQKDEEDTLESAISASTASTKPAEVNVIQDLVADVVEEKRGPKPVAFDLAIASKGVTIVFGSESGNAEELADMAATGLKEDGHAVQVLDAANVDVTHVSAFANLLIITSTWGEGDPPSNAIDLVGDLKNEALGHDFKGVKFSVLALGDTNYDMFCQCGKEFDSILEKYGAQRFSDRVDCDVDFEEPYAKWLSAVRGSLKSGLNTVPEYVEPVVEEAVKEEAPTPVAEVALTVAAATETVVETTSEPVDEVVSAATPAPSEVKFDAQVAANGISIIFGSESGNAEDLASMAKEALEGDGHPVQVVDAGDVTSSQLKAFANLLIITSTWGEGDPPSNALDLVGELKDDSLGHDFKGVKFSVLALGDTSYDMFCQCGKDFDNLLEKYGAERLAKRVDCDVDFEENYEAWLADVQGVLKQGLNKVPALV